MKNFFGSGFSCALLAIAIFLGPACTPPGERAKTANEGSAQKAAVEAERILNIYCWSNYFSPELIKHFEEKTKSRIIQNYFSSNEELLAKLQAGARGYDLIVPTSYLLKALKELKLIEPLGKLDWPELNQLSPRFQSPPFDPTHEYSVPYQWGTTGIAINRAKIKDKIDSWAWLFDHPELAGQITMLEDPPAVVGSALKYLGYPYNESSPEAFAKVKALLTKQKKLLKAYTPEAQSVLASGEVAIAQAYSGDTQQVKARQNPNIEYVLPKEGGEIFIDSLVIPQGAPSPALAKDFIRFTLQQNIAELQVRHLFFSPVVKTNMDASFLSNPAIFPTEAQLRKFEVMIDDPKRLEAIQKLWTEFKAM